MALYYLFGTLALVSGIIVISSNNPVHSALFLILSFLNTAGLLFILGAEFLAFVFLIVYVGAISVLFLFVVIMLNIRMEERESPVAYLPAGIMLSLLVCAELYVVLSADFFPMDTVSLVDSSLHLFSSHLETLGNVESIGMVLYTQYVVSFMLAGMVLLVAMVGAIVLTLEGRTGFVHKQHVMDQLDRDVKDSIFLA